MGWHLLPGNSNRMGWNGGGAVTVPGGVKKDLDVVLMDVV